MQIDVFGQSFTLTDPIAKHVGGRVSQALAPLRASAVRGATVRLRDVNGPRGGVDKGCRIVVRIPRGKAVVVDAVDRDLYAAVDAAAAKLREGTWRRQRRERTLSRGPAGRRVRRRAS